MRTFILLVAIFACVSAIDNKNKPQSPQAVKRRLDKIKQLQPRYKSFLLRMNKDIKDLTDEKLISRQQNYLNNEAFTKNFNEKNNLGFILDENEYTDRNPEKYLRIMSSYVQPDLTSTQGPKFNTSKITISKDIEAEDSVDYRDQMTKVGRELHCPASWAFSTAAILEYYHKKNNFWTDEVSKENLIECSPYSKGCENGGSSVLTMAWLKHDSGSKVASEADYSYAAGDTDMAGKCEDAPRKLNLKYKNVFHLKVKNEEQVKKLLTMYGPLGTSIFINAEKKSTFLFYKSGVYSNPDCPVCNADKYDCPANFDVVLVGYGTTNDGVDYWIIRNCWGETWGEKGYMRIVRNKKNNCSIGSEVWGVI